MRYIFILSIIIITVCTGSPLIAADLFSQQHNITKNDSTPDLITLQEDQAMTAQEMVEILVATTEESKVLPNRVMMVYRGIELTCIYDETHDRMRIIAPIAARGDITPEQFENAMEANFHTALDARYALNQGVLFAAYIHPLSLLTRGQIENALDQTATLAATFGKEYTSGFLTYRGGGNPL